MWHVVLMLNSTARNSNGTSTTLLSRYYGLVILIFHFIRLERAGPCACPKSSGRTLLTFYLAQFGVIIVLMRYCHLLLWHLIVVSDINSETTRQNFHNRAHCDASRKAAVAPVNAYALIEFKNRD